MKKTKIEINREEFPNELRQLLENATVYDSSCSSDAKVYYLDTGYYIKTDVAHALAKEAEMTSLFHSIGFGVEVLAYVTAEKDYLVTREAVGEDLTHYLQDPEKLCALLATSLRKLHANPIQSVPISPRYERYMESASGDCSGGCYDEFVLLDRYPIASKEEAWAIMQENKELLKADTLIHGDACLPNIIQNGGALSAFIDFNLAGVGDRHIDLYWAIWSLQYNLKTSAYTDLFLDLYGREHFNEDMLRVVAAFELFG